MQPTVIYVPVTLSFGKPVTAMVALDVSGLQMPPDATLDSAAGLDIRLPHLCSPKRPSGIQANGVPRKVAACVCRVLREIADGARDTRIRPEVQYKIERDLRELLPFLRRDDARKVLNKAALYVVQPGLSVSVY